MAFGTEDADISKETEAYRKFAQGQLEGFATVETLYHLLNHAVSKGYAKDIGDRRVRRGGRA
jgi:hypothetical protein